MRSPSVSWLHSVSRCQGGLKTFRPSKRALVATGPDTAFGFSVGAVGELPPTMGTSPVGQALRCQVMCVSPQTTISLIGREVRTL